jgi:hypothetical protein
VERVPAHVVDSQRLICKHRRFGFPKPVCHERLRRVESSSSMAIFSHWPAAAKRTRTLRIDPGVLSWDFGGSYLMREETLDTAERSRQYDPRGPWN